MQAADGFQHKQAKFRIKDFKTQRVTQTSMLQHAQNENKHIQPLNDLRKATNKTGNPILMSF